MKIDITHSQYDKMIDIMTDVLFDNLNHDEIEALMMYVERLPSSSSDISDRAYDIGLDIIEALNREEFVDTLVIASIIRMFE